MPDVDELSRRFDEVRRKIYNCFHVENSEYPSNEEIIRVLLKKYSVEEAGEKLREMGHSEAGIRILLSFMWRATDWYELDSPYFFFTVTKDERIWFLRRTYEDRTWRVQPNLIYDSPDGRMYYWVRTRPVDEEILELLREFVEVNDALVECSIPWPYEHYSRKKCPSLRSFLASL